MRSSLLLSSAVVCAALAAACGNYQEPEFGPPGAIIDKRLPQDKSRGSTPGATDGATDEGPFAGTSPTSLDKVALDEHTARGGPAEAQAVDCMKSGCHDGAGAPPKFVAAGKLATGADVLLVASDGTKIGPVTADTNGFFWFREGDIGQGAQAYARKDGKLFEMVASINAAENSAVSGGNCVRESCHGADRPVVPP